MTTDITVAVIGAVAVIVVAAIERVRRQNSREHAENGARIGGLDYTLGKIDGKLDHLHDKIDTHLSDHRSDNV